MRGSKHHFFICPGDRSHKVRLVEINTFVIAAAVMFLIYVIIRLLLRR